jgi:hypothetical protein
MLAFVNPYLFSINDACVCVSRRIHLPQFGIAFFPVLHSVFIIVQICLPSRRTALSGNNLLIIVFQIGKRFIPKYKKDGLGLEAA